MKALCWQAPGKVAVADVPDPALMDGMDVIVRVTTAAICGSDLHLYSGYIPATMPGDVLGHEFMGEVVEVGDEVTRLRPGDRVVVPFPIACGACRACQRDLWSLCENSNPNAALAEKLMGHSPAGIFGYSHLLGGFQGGHAEYVRVPFADVGPLKIEDDLTDEQVLFLGDILPTGYMAAEMCGIRDGDVVAVWGAGPVGQFAIASAYLLGASMVIAVDRFPERLRLAADEWGAHPVNYAETSVLEELRELTAGRGPDHCVDAVGMEAHTDVSLLNAYDKTKHLARLETERPHALRQAILACANGGTVSVVGVYGGLSDKIPTGSLMNRSITVRTGQTHVHRYMRPLLERVRRGEIDPTVVISHRLPLTEAPRGYDLFKHKRDGCTKVVLTT
ncbi:zinc-dependent alcohol dehydrogenase [Jiangella asiatica]|uniref:Glutathione-dependent formaldehyde dehydrogenase n=1 Tax=Jiangella asiatica TaxID=2530372 RepID=A0A4R5CZW7_9ACTN|nr:glutathione-dependent formaldehyde dehydrogenase [Jiangella asiatica]